MVVATVAFAAATAAMLRGVEPFTTWYYSFAWWSYIVFADAWLIRRGGKSVLLRNPNTSRLLVLSVAIWVTFEIHNFRLENWHYLEIPPELAVRWFGYAIAYATVLPGIFVTSELVGSFTRHRRSGGVPLPSNLPRRLFYFGVVGSILPWLAPRYTFPLVWLGPTALFAALNFRLGGEGILRDIEQRGPRRLYCLAGAGLICGLLWECWNFWARSKWVYEIPFFSGSPLFEMPIAGFLGFPPFAVECYEMYVAAQKLLQRLASRPGVRWVFWIILAVYVAVGFWGIDTFTVRTFQE
jgi:hypothetical protein